MSFRLAAILVSAISITACSGNSYNSASLTAPTPAPPDSTTVTIQSGASTQTTTAFGVNPLAVSVGTTISWLNGDNTTHTAVADANQWASGDIPPNGRFNFTFASAGRFTYHCRIHPNMVGTIIVE